MCVIALAWQAHPRWPLVLIANRDEHHARPSSTLAHWPDQPTLLAGRDDVSGGTWLGVSTTGRLACVTNVASPDGPDPALRSRGALVVNGLTHGPALVSGSDFSPYSFNPFNLIIADRFEARLATNRPTAEHRVLTAGLHGLSNGPATSLWPKTAFLLDRLSFWLNAHGADDEILFSALRAETLPHEGDAPFIRHPVYGTRCSTIVRVDQSGSGMMIERSFDRQGKRIGEARRLFCWT